VPVALLGLHRHHGHLQLVPHRLPASLRRQLLRHLPIGLVRLVLHRLHRLLVQLPQLHRDQRVHRLQHGRGLQPLQQRVLQPVPRGHLLERRIVRGLQRHVLGLHIGHQLLGLQHGLLPQPDIVPGRLSRWDLHWQRIRLPAVHVALHNLRHNGHPVHRLHDRHVPLLKHLCDLVSCGDVPERVDLRQLQHGRVCQLHQHSHNVHGLLWLNVPLRYQLCLDLPWVHLCRHDAIASVQRVHLRRVRQLHRIGHVLHQLHQCTPATLRHDVLRHVPRWVLQQQHVAVLDLPAALHDLLGIGLGVHRMHQWPLAVPESVHVRVPSRLVPVEHDHLLCLLLLTVLDLQRHRHVLHRLPRQPAALQRHLLQLVPCRHLPHGPQHVPALQRSLWQLHCRWHVVLHQLRVVQLPPVRIAVLLGCLPAGCLRERPLCLRGLHRPVRQLLHVGDSLHRLHRQLATALREPVLRHLPRRLVPALRIHDHMPGLLLLVCHVLRVCLDVSLVSVLVTLLQRHLLCVVPRKHVRGHEHDLRPLQRALQLLHGIGLVVHGLRQWPAAVRVGLLQHVPRRHLRVLVDPVQQLHRSLRDLQRCQHDLHLVLGRLPPHRRSHLCVVVPHRIVPVQCLLVPVVHAAMHRLLGPLPGPVLRLLHRLPPVPGPVHGRMPSRHLCRHTSHLFRLRSQLPHVQWRVCLGLHQLLVHHKPVQRHVRLAVPRRILQ